MRYLIWAGTYRKPRSHCCGGLQEEFRVQTEDTKITNVLEMFENWQEGQWVWALSMGKSSERYGQKEAGRGLAGRSCGTLQIRVRTLDFTCERKTCVREVRIGRGLYLHFKRILFLFFPLPKSLSLQSLHLPYLYQNLGKVENLLHSLVWYPDGVKHLHLWGVIG